VITLPGARKRSYATVSTSIESRSVSHGIRIEYYFIIVCVCVFMHEPGSSF
jgi:hypothetical protein